MAGAATITAPKREAKSGEKKVIATVPFVRASFPRREPFFDKTILLTTSDQDQGTIDIPAIGYLRSLYWELDASGGTGGTPAVTATEDAPWTTLKNIMLTEPNGSPIVQFNSGYDMHLAHKWGGYRKFADFKADPNYTAIGATFATYAYHTRMPIELNERDGLGSLPNQNSAATFKLKFTVAKVADIATGTLPTTLPSVRIRIYTEAWDQPDIQSGGQTNALTPPAMGTTQFWTSQVINYNSGYQTLRLTRMGNFLRNLIFIPRRTSGTRANGGSDWPDELRLVKDTRPLDIIQKDAWEHQMSERTGYGQAHGSTVPALDSANGLDAGVWVYDFTHEWDGQLGYENRDLWDPTIGSTRYELQGTFANAGSLTVLTNDVSVAGQVFV